MVEVTSFTVLDNQTPGALVLIDSSGCRYIEDIQSICVVGSDILDNVIGRKLVWKRLIPLCKNHHLVHLLPYHYLQ